MFIMIITMPYIGHCKPIFLGDSLTYQLAVSYKEHSPVDAQYLVGSGLSNNKNLDWIEYARSVNVKNYDTVYIVLGTNDFISSNEINNYKEKAAILIRELKTKNKNIVWLIPPTLKDINKDQLLQNTRAAIYKASVQEGIKMIDMRSALGMRYTKDINGIQIRTDDGVHITKNGADAIVLQIKKSNYIDY